jgi:ATP-binding cassette, subfamily B, bacterial
MNGSLRSRLYQILRVDRALRLVWESGRRFAVVSSVVLVLQGLLPVASLYLIKRIIDEVVLLVQEGADGTAVGSVLALIAAAAGLAIVSSLVSSVAGWLQEAQSQIVTDHVQDVLHEKSVNVDYGYYENPAYHDTLHRAQEEAPYRPSAVLSHLFTLLHAGVALLGISVLLIATFHWGLVLVLLATGLPVVAVRLRFADELYRWRTSRTETERRVDYLNFVLTGSWHAKEVRSFGLGELLSGQSRELRATLRGERLAIAKRQMTIDLVVHLSQTVALFAAFGYVVVRALRGMQSVGDIVMLYQAFQRGQGFLQSMVGSLGSLYENNLFLSYLYDFLALPQRVASPEAPRVVPDRMETGLATEGVEFTYPSRPQKVLRGVDLAIRPGELVAVTGENGAGKSTLLRLLCRLHDPSAGAVKLDGTDLREFDLDSLRRTVGVLFQDLTPYYVSAAENIRFGDVHAEPDKDRIVDAAVRSGADEFIRDLPREYDTVLGVWFDDAAELSVGQWKKIALARLLYSNRPILLLDEPTTGLDPGSENKLLRLLRQLARDRAVLIVSHRLSTVSQADRIYVLHEGRVIETGSHDSLRKLDGVYASLCREQALV